MAVTPGVPGLAVPGTFVPGQPPVTSSITTYGTATLAGAGAVAALVTESAPVNPTGAGVLAGIQPTTFYQRLGIYASGSSVSSFGISVGAATAAAGTSVVVSVRSYTTGSKPTGVSDTKNTYYLLYDATAIAAGWYIYRADLTSALTTSDTITISYSGAQAGGVAIADAVQALGVLDVATSASVTHANPAVDAIQAVNGDNFIYACYIYGGNDNTETWTTGGSFTSTGPEATSSNSMITGYDATGVSGANVTASVVNPASHSEMFALLTFRQTTPPSGQLEGITAPAGAGAIAALTTSMAPAAVNAAGTVAALVTQGAVANATGIGATSSPCIQGAISSPAGSGTVAALVTQGVIAAAVGAGTVAATGSNSIPATASLTAAGAVGALAATGSGAPMTGSGAVNAPPVTTLTPASAAGAGAAQALLTTKAPVTATGAGAVAAPAVQAAGANPAGAGTAGALVTELPMASPAGTGSASSLAAEDAIAEADGAGAVTATGSTVLYGSASCVGAGVIETGSIAPGSATISGSGSVSASASVFEKPGMAAYGVARRQPWRGFVKGLVSG